MTRHIGAFIQNTVKPLVEELDKLLGKCKHLKFKRKDIELMVKVVMDYSLIKTIIHSVTYLILGAIFCRTVWLILR